MKYLIGSIFCIGMGIFSLYKNRAKGIMVALASFFAGVVFFGQFLIRR